jgi:hypothetical protein
VRARYQRRSGDITPSGVFCRSDIRLTEKAQCWLVRTDESMGPVPGSGRDTHDLGTSSADMDSTARLVGRLCIDRSW